MLKKLLFAVLFFFLALYFIISHYYGDTQINKYKDKIVVQEQKAIDKGWVPAILPDSAYEITETHDIDTNELFGAFYYKEQDEAKLMKELILVPDSNQTFEWGSFLFKVYKKINHVKYRNK